MSPPTPTTETRFTVRHAQPSEAPKIAALLEPYAKQRIVLARSPEDILQYIANFLVACDLGGKVIGAVALRDFGEGLEEIRSLVVDREWAGTGIGSGLIAAALEVARKRRTRRVFALTLRPRLFERAGFTQVEMANFPQKVWADCVNCPKYDCCDEIALVLDL